MQSDNEYVYCEHTSQKFTGRNNYLGIDYTVISKVTSLEFCRLKIGPFI